MTDNYNYSSDVPVQKQAEDRFSRWTFASRIAQIIAERSDPSSIIIGLNGAWGDGKTSVLNFIEHSLDDNDNVVCIKFNPWRFGSEEELLNGFFIDVTESLDAKLMTKGDTFKGILKKSASGVAAAAGAKGAGDSIASFISGPSIDELKKRVEEALEKVKKRVLILVDDIDRLDKNEIHALFRIVKLTADFKYTAYILAFDQDVVAASLQERYAGSSSNSGHSFLEKIIQVPLHLPAVEKTVLQNFCYEGVNEAIRVSNIELTEQQCQEFSRDFSLAFDDCLTTPRKAKLYGNILLFSLPILAGEVNPVDCMLIEAIRVFYPNLYDFIRNNKGIFVGSFNDRSSSNYKSEIETIKNLLSDVFIRDSISNVRGVTSLLKSLFPKLESVYGNTNYGSDWNAQWAKAQRICSDNYFSRYFNYSIPIGDIADKEIKNLIGICETNDSSSDYEQIVKLVLPIFTKDNAGNLIRKLRNRVDEISEKASCVLAFIIAVNHHNYPNPKTLFNFQVPFVQAAMLIGDLIQNIKSKESRIDAAKGYLKAANNLEFQLQIMRWLKRESDEKPNEDRFNEEEIDTVGEYFAELIKDYLETGIDITVEHQDICPSIFYMMKKYISEQYVSDYLGNLLKNDNNIVFSLLESFTNTAWGMETGVSHKSDFERSEYDSLVDYVPADVILSNLNLALGDDFPEVHDDYPYDYKDNRNLKLAAQFVWLNNYVETKNAEEIEQSDE